MIKVNCEVKAHRGMYDDGDVKTSVRVCSHPNDPDVVVVIVDGATRNVLAKEMIAAIENATRTCRFG